ncbi:MAG: phosphate signaling complex protein PhoU [Deltaproteobacteria bacterium]|nr:MAG: phosphate signaling complex protein PhoU [Deltaproteobacteria bacterium]
MPSRLEESLQRDIDQIRSRVIKMGTMAEGALRASLHALTQADRQLAYSVILRDRYIDELEMELDRLCQQFLVRQHPAAGHLRFVYAVIKINNELERIGDYAESIARHLLRLRSVDPQPSYEKIEDIAKNSIPMLRNAMRSFAEQNPELARATMDMEDKVDDIRWDIHHELIRLNEDGKLPSEGLPSLMTIVTRFERVADRACNICEEVLYMCTGEGIKHKGKEIFRVLFVDERDACRGQIAAGIGNSLGLERFKFSSAGVAPRPVDLKTVDFLAEKGIDISEQTSKYLEQIIDFENYQIVVSLCREAEIACPLPPSKTVSLRWELENPSRVEGSEEEIRAAYEKTYQILESHIRELVEAIIGNDFLKKEKT